MAKIRDDLIGVVHVGGVVLSAGDEVPDGAVVADSLLAPAAPSRGGRGRRKSAQSGE